MFSIITKCQSKWEMLTPIINRTRRKLPERRPTVSNFRQRVFAQPFFSEGNNSAWRSGHDYPPEQGPISRPKNDQFTYNSFPHLGPFGSECPPVRLATFEGNPLCRPGQNPSVQSGHGVSANITIHHGNNNLPLRGRQYKQNPQYMTSQTELSPARDRSVPRENPIGDSRHDANKISRPTMNGCHVSELGGPSRQEPLNRIRCGHKEDATALRLEPHRAQQSNHIATGAMQNSAILTTMKEPPKVNEVSHV